MSLSHAWATSSHSTPDGGNCVQARLACQGTVQVRESKTPDSATLAFTYAEWLAFTAAIKKGSHNA